MHICNTEQWQTVTDAAVGRQTPELKGSLHLSPVANNLPYGLNFALKSGKSLMKLLNCWKFHRGKKLCSDLTSTHPKVAPKENKNSVKLKLSLKNIKLGDLRGKK